MSIESELEEIRESDPEGLLRPAAIVHFAEDPKKELWLKFDWDDKKAGYEHRLWQARKLIVSVRIIRPNGEEQIEFQAYVSLTSDRITGGYRSLVSVMDDSELRVECLQDAKMELHRMRGKYGHLKELAEVFAAVDKMAG